MDGEFSGLIRRLRLWCTVLYFHDTLGTSAWPGANMDFEADTLASGSYVFGAPSTWTYSESVGYTYDVHDLIQFSSTNTA